MCKIIKNSIPLFLVVLKLLSAEAKRSCSNPVNCTTNATIHDLKVVCSLADAKKTLSFYPTLCTTYAQYTNDMDLLRRMNGIKGDLPFMILIDTINFSEEGVIHKTLSQFNDIIYDFIAFDLFKILESNKKPGDASKAIVDWFNSMKVDGGVNFGFIIQNDVNWLKEKSIDFKAINEVSDFYVLQSTGYRKCHYKVHQGDMPALATKEDVAGSIDALKEMGVDLSILVYTIDLKIESMLVVDSEDMSYSYLCANTLSEKRKYCFNTIECLFDKARLRFDKNVTGVFVQGIDYDDYDGKCNCKTETDPGPCFRGLKTISEASQENVKNVSCYTCTDGGFPVINT